MSLSRLNETQGNWQRLLDSWAAQCKVYNENFEEFGGPVFAHSIEIVRSRSTPNYGIFGYTHDNETHAILHINKASLPGTTGTTLRALYVLLAPKYDFEDVDPKYLSQIASGIVFSIAELAQDSEFCCQHIKLHLGNSFDRAFWTDVVRGMVERGATQFSVRGNWLHGESVGAPAGPRRIGLRGGG